jgi:hypothetical protein
MRAELQWLREIEYFSLYETLTEYVDFDGNYTRDPPAPPSRAERPK